MEITNGDKESIVARILHCNDSMFVMVDMLKIDKGIKLNIGGNFIYGWNVKHLNIEDFRACVLITAWFSYTGFCCTRLLCLIFKLNSSKHQNQSFPLHDF